MNPTPTESNRYPSPADPLFTLHARYLAFRDAYVLHARMSRESALADALSHLDLTDDDVPDILALESQFGHDLVAFTEWLRERLPPALRSRLHAGLTSSDIVDTALASTLYAASAILNTQALALRATLASTAIHHATTPILARTHGRHAIPTSLGRRWAPFAFQADRAIATLEHATAPDQGISVYHFAGPVGIDPQHPGAQAHPHSPLKRDPAPTQVSSRDRHAYFAFALTALAQAADAPATEIRLGAQSGVDLYSEPLNSPTLSHRGSSAMPHKRNPHRAERINGLTRVVRHNAAALQDSTLWNERDISHSSVERTALPLAVTTTSFLLQETADLVARLDIHPAEESARVLQSGPSSPAVVAALVQRGVSHSKAYETVRDFGAAQTAAAHGLPDTPTLYDPAAEPGLWATLRSWAPSSPPPEPG